MDLLTWENTKALGYFVFWYIVWPSGVIFGAINAYQAVTGKITAGFAWSRTRKLDYLRKQRERLIRLHESDREYYGWLLAGVLWVLGMFAIQLALEGLALGPFRFGSPQKQAQMSLVLATGRFALGVSAYFTVVSRVKDYQALQRFDRTIAFLDRQIATLEAKTPLQPVPAGL